MLKAHVVRLGGHAYYINDLVPGRAEGVEVGGERPGQWIGSATGSLGLSGAVQLDPFAAVLAGHDPRSGLVLGGRRNTVTVAGYDLTFCAPKSVSLMYSLAPREIGQAVGAGHDAAIEATADYLSRRAVGVTRHQHGTVQLLPSTGMVAGSFLHRTSRDLDPHLHTHVVVANVGCGLDGTWSALDSRRVFKHLETAGQLYRSHLRMELTERLGVTWTEHQRGFGDVVGIDPGLRRLFSQRSVAIEQYLFETSSRTLSPKAYLATRPAKDQQVTVGELVPKWRQRAADFNFDLGELSAVVGRGRDGLAERQRDSQRLEPAIEAKVPPDGTLTRHQLVGLVASARTDGSSVRVNEETTDRLLGPLKPVDVARDQTIKRATMGVEPRWSARDVLGQVRTQAPLLDRESNERTPQERGRGSEVRVHAREVKERSPVERSPAAHVVSKGDLGRGR